MATPSGPLVPPLKVLIPLYTGFNTLDVNGPLDVLCNFALRPTKNPIGSFVITTTAKGMSTKEIVPGTERSTPVVVKAWEFIDALADCTFDEVIPRIEAGEFDIMLIPGSGRGYVDALVKDPENPDQIVDVVKAFMNHDTQRGKKYLDQPDLQHKWLVSVCTGAMVAGAAGCFKGRDATTHKAALGVLKDVCDRFGVPGKFPDPLVPRRWVYGGQADPAPNQKVKTNILSSGGISCGLDASLVLVKEVLGADAAWGVANIMDYNWNVTAKPPKSAGVKITPPDELR